MRHIRLVEISNYGLFHGVLDLLLASFTQSCQSIEWSKCDDLLMTSVSLYFLGASYFTTDTAHGYVLIKVHISLLRFPKTTTAGFIKTLVAGFDSNALDAIVQSYATLYKLPRYSELVSPANISVLSLPGALKLHERLASPPERALAGLCANTLARLCDSEEAEHIHCQALAKLVER